MNSVKILQQQFGTYPTADIKNLATMISEFADLSKQREIKINALGGRLDHHVYAGDDNGIGESGMVVFKHNGERFLCVDMREKMHGSNYDDLSREFWSEGYVRCKVCRLYEHGRPNLGHGRHFVQGGYVAAWRNWKDLAKQLLETIDDKKFCTLCGELTPRYSPRIDGRETSDNNTICQDCALDEMKTSCIHCKSIMGRADDPGLERLEHPACKRRRIE